MANTTNAATLQDALNLLSQPEHLSLLANIQRGIEKEGLRCSSQGVISQKPHPKGLGSALTHDSITTDYSEALLEFITRYLVLPTKRWPIWKSLTVIPTASWMVK